MFDIEEIDVIGKADKGFTFDILNGQDEPTGAKITIAGVYGKKGKDCRVKYEAKERELLRKFNLTGKKIEEINKKVEEKEPVEEEAVKNLMDYEDALEDAYIKTILVPLTIAVEGLKMGGEDFILNDKNVFALYKKYPTVLGQAMREIYNVENLAKN